MGNSTRGGNPPGALAIAGAYAGTVIGAGFASGQEILQFFTAFGRAGLLGVAVAFILFAVSGIRMLELGRRFNARSHRTVVRFAGGRWAGPALDGVLTAFLLGTAVAMASGAGAVGVEQLGWPRWLGSGLLTAVTAATVMAGLHGVVRSIGFVAPALIASVLVMSAYALATGSGLGPSLAWEGDPRLGAVPFWFVAAPLYVAYNAVLAVPVLTPLGPAASSPAALRWGGLLGGLGLALGAAAIHLAIAGHMPEAARWDIPMLHTARGFPSWVPAVYTVLLLAEVYTTAVATLFGFASRLGERGGRWFAGAVAAGGAVMLIGGQFQFAAVVGTLYPVMGVAGGALLLGLLRRHPDGPR